MIKKRTSFFNEMTFFLHGGGDGSELDARFDELLSQMTDADRADLLEYMEFKVAKRKENPNG